MVSFVAFARSSARSTRSFRSALLPGLLALASGACHDQATLTSPTLDAELPASAASAPSRAIPDRYIITFHSGVANGAELARQITQGNGGTLHFTYSHVLNGFAATLPAQALEGIRRNPHVAAVSQDQQVAADESQSNATWGLDRIDQNALPLDQVYGYIYTGQGVTAYIVDSGIRFDHTEFEGRAVRGYDAMNDGQNGSDCHGHGTHVAGTVGGRTWGVAKSVKLVSVRVLGCDGGGTVSGLIAGIDWVAKNHVKPAVANISIGAGQSSDLNSALRNMINAGIQSSVSAGNSDADACNQSPASTAEAITVGATLPSDARRTSSNWGSCVDLFAPGSSITSASHADSTGSTLKSGTSMAAPHVAGVAALLLQESSGLTPQELRDRIWEMSTKNIVTDAKSQNAHLLYSLSGAAPPSKPAPTAPSAPGSLAAKEMTSSRVDLSWADQSSNEDGFEIQRKTGTGSYVALGQVAANSTSFSDGTVQSGTSSTYRVRAYNAGGESFSNEASLTTSIPVTTPAAPANLAAKVVTLSRVDLSWADQSSNEDGFRIERKTGTGSWGTLTQVGANATLYSDASVQKDVTYSYRVIAFTAAGSVSSNEVTSKVACKTRPKTTTCQ